MERQQRPKGKIFLSKIFKREREKMGERHAWCTPWHFSEITQNLLLPRPILSRPHAVAPWHHVSKMVNTPAVHVLTRSQLKTAPMDLSEGERRAGREQWADEEEEVCTGKGWPQFLCVPSVATAVSGSAEHKSHQGELSGTAEETQQRKKVSVCWETLQDSLLLHRICWLLS